MDGGGRSASRRLAAWGIICLLLALAIGAVSSDVAAGQRRPAPKVHLLRCAKGSLRMFQFGGKHPKLVTPRTARQLPPRGARQVCVSIPKIGSGKKVVAAETGNALRRALARLPRRLRSRFRPSPPRVLALVNRVLAGGALAGLAADRPQATAASAWGSASPISVSGKVGADAEATATGSSDIHSDDCPSGAGRVDGSSSMQVQLRLSAPGVKGGLTIGFNSSGTWHVDVGDDGHANHLHGSFKAEEAIHVAMGGVYDYARQDVSATADVALYHGSPQLSDLTGTTNGSTELLGGDGYDKTISSLVDNINSSITNVSFEPWQHANACFALDVTADKQTAPRGGQLTFTFQGHAHDGSPENGTFTQLGTGGIKEPCPGQLGLPPVFAGGSAQVSETDPQSQWVEPANACIYGEVQTRAGRGFASLKVPAGPASDRVTGSMSFTLTDHSGDCNPDDEAYSQDWNGNGSINATRDISTGPVTDGSQLTLNGSWSNSFCDGIYAGSASGSVSGETNDAGVGTSVDWGYSVSHPGLLQLDLSFQAPASVSQNSTEDCVSSDTVNAEVVIHLNVPDPGPGHATSVHVDRSLPLYDSSNPEAESWSGPVAEGCGVLDPANSVMHVSGDLSIQRG